jgi:hypothetical protein
MKMKYAGWEMRTGLAEQVVMEASAAHGEAVEDV